MAFPRLALSVILSFALASSSFALETDRLKAAEGAKRFMNTLDQPGPLTYRQMINLMRPFATTEFSEEMENRFRSRLDERFPQYSLNDTGKTVEIDIGTKSVREKLIVFKDDKEVFAQIGKIKFTHVEMNDFFLALKKFDENARKNSSSKKSALRLFILGEDAFADSDWGWAIGLGALGLFIGGGIYLAAKSISNSQITMNHNINVPTNYSINGQVNGQVNANATVGGTVTGAITVPQLDPYLKHSTEKGQK